jgi:hypothetical protein
MTLVACGRDDPPPPAAEPARPAPAAAPAPPRMADDAPRAVSTASAHAGFEQPGALPYQIPGWTLSQHAGVKAYEMDVDTASAADGHASFRIHRTQPQVYGTISQTIDVSALAGKKVELRARVKVADVGKEGWMLFIDSSGSRESTTVSGSADWREVTVSMTLPAGAKTASIGAMLLDGGTAWLDDVRLTEP